MKRDMDLIRKILFYIEENDDISVAVDGYDQRAISYHIRLLDEADLIHAAVLSSNSGEIVIQESGQTRLTWSGHEFIDAAREPTRWNKVKAALGDATIAAYIGLLNQVAIHYATKAAGIEN
ncbi:hypothetical protein Poly51_02130 [Rubripirellula tenax]|uniref:DUF2513 domain-containing protein n=1 Tax=Rubripirellula tenax TaxID=2528015 RepID=A0A5C6FGI4_9BACT|nr:DUF2513 domain-containing protein [Rubripirellula tenax]TWU59940.1 hypothetical protein Poly51_02130 [Rubripirellula tenax]